MDFADIASEREQLDRTMALAAQIGHAPALIAVGVCYNCEASVPSGVCFCDHECRDDYEKRKAAEARR